MKIVIREKAAGDLDGIFAWIAKDNPSAAVGVIRCIRDRIERLGTPGLAHIGRPGLVDGTRELVEAPQDSGAPAAVPRAAEWCSSIAGRPRGEG